MIYGVTVHALFVVNSHLADLRKPRADSGNQGIGSAMRPDSALCRCERPAQAGSGSRVAGPRREQPRRVLFYFLGNVVGHRAAEPWPQKVEQQHAARRIGIVPGLV